MRNNLSNIAPLIIGNLGFIKTKDNRYIAFNIKNNNKRAEFRLDQNNLTKIIGSNLSELLTYKAMVIIDRNYTYITGEIDG